MRNGYSAADSRGSQILTALQHLEEHSFGLLVQPQKADELLEDLILRSALQLELDCVFAEKLT